VRPQQSSRSLADCWEYFCRYLDAIADATKATTLDSTYSKGWGRLASAYLASARYVSTIEVFRKALDCLPKDILTASDLRQKTQYEEGLSECTDKVNNPKKADGIEIDSRDLRLVESPWRRAEKYLTQNIDQPEIIGNTSIRYLFCIKQ